MLANYVCKMLARCWPSFEYSLTRLTCLTLKFVEIWQTPANQKKLFDFHLTRGPERQPAAGGELGLAGGEQGLPPRQRDGVARGLRSGGCGDDGKIWNPGWGKIEQLVVTLVMVFFYYVNYCEETYCAETNCAASSKLRGITNAELPMVHFSRFLRGSFFGCINVNVCD